MDEKNNPIEITINDNNDYNIIFEAIKSGFDAITTALSQMENVSAEVIIDGTKITDCNTGILIKGRNKNIIKNSIIINKNKNDEEGILV